MKLSVLIPVLNEETTLEEIVRRVQATPYEKELILIDDGSDDGTPAIMARLAEAHDNITVLRHETNQGKGAALASALEHFTGDVVLIQDADLEYDPAQIPALVEPIEKGAADAVFGSRVLGENKLAHRSFGAGSRALTLMINVMFRGKLTDAATCYKAMHRSVYETLPLAGSGFELDFEIAARLLRTDCRILELPIRYEPRSLAQGKKIRPVDGFRAVKQLLLLRFGLL